MYDEFEAAEFDHADMSDDQIRERIAMLLSYERPSQRQRREEASLNAELRRRDHLWRIATLERAASVGARALSQLIMK